MVHEDARLKNFVLLMVSGPVLSGYKRSKNATINAADLLVCQIGMCFAGHVMSREARKASDEYEVYFVVNESGPFLIRL